MVSTIQPARKLLKLSAVAARLDTAVDSVAKLIRAGKLRAYDVSTGRKRATWRVDESDLEAYLAGAVAIVAAPPAPRRKRYQPATPVTEYFK